MDNIQELMTKLRSALKGAKVVAVTCLQWGDTGKGKFVDLLADWADIIVRGTGGDNAGHSIVVGDKEYVFHILPSGMLHDKNGKRNIVGSGTAINPRTLLGELSLLHEAGFSTNRLMISTQAKLILPTHIVADRVKEAMAKQGKIGTTGRGIGPVYSDFVARNGLVMNDLLNPDILLRKLQKHLRIKRQELACHELEVIEEVMKHPYLDEGRYFCPENIFDEQKIYEAFLDYGVKLEPYISDTDTFVRRRMADGDRVLLEGAQGVLLSIDHGSYPYVTSSDPSVQGLAKGAGLSMRDVDLSLGIVKGFYMTRVGEGPFPTELGGRESAAWCSGQTKEEEESLDLYKLPFSQAPDDFHRGVILRRLGGEYGATTRRPRRTGWLDIPLLKHAVRFATHLVMTKLDVLDGLDEIKICVSYKYEGPDRVYGQRKLSRGDIISEAIMDCDILADCRPEYLDFTGWDQKTSDIRDRNDLPAELLRIMESVESMVGTKVFAISVGPDREETITM